MSVLADKIEQIILEKLLGEQDEDIVLRRNELADELDCAPSQISYVLSTRFSNDKGFTVESRRGSGGFVRIVRMNRPAPDLRPVTLKETLPVLSISLDDLDAFLYKLMERQTITNREAILLHHTFEALYDEVDEPERFAVIQRILRHVTEQQ